MPGFHMHLLTYVPVCKLWFNASPVERLVKSDVEPYYFFKTLLTKEGKEEAWPSYGSESDKRGRKRESQWKTLNGREKVTQKSLSRSIRSCVIVMM